jgi:hypothetical protein
MKSIVVTLLVLLSDHVYISSAFVPKGKSVPGGWGAVHEPSATHHRSVAGAIHEVYTLEKQSSGSTTIYGLTDDDDVLFGDDDENDNGSDERCILGKAIAQGKTVLCLPDMASSEECEALFSTAFQAAQTQKAARGRARFSVSDPTVFDGSIVVTAEEILLRVLDYVDEYIPSIYQWLFDPFESDWLNRQPLNAALEQPTVPPERFLGEMCTCLRDLYMQGALEWSEGEPAINIYQCGGYFGAHKDHLALTVLIPLTSADGFEGYVLLLEH